MALFKIFKGNDSSKLTNTAVTGYKPLTDGYAYYDTSTKLFYIDAFYPKTNSNGSTTLQLDRQPINADQANIAAISVKASYLGNNFVTIQATDTKQAKITLEQLMTWLITNEKILVNKEGNSAKPLQQHVYIPVSWNYADNDILQLECNGTDYELQLAGCIIEFWGQAIAYNKGVYGIYRLGIHTSPTTDFTVSSGYTKFPVSSYAEYTCNDSTENSSYNPIWRMETTNPQIIETIPTASRIYYIPFMEGKTGDQKLRANNHFYYYDDQENNTTYLNSGNSTSLKNYYKGGLTLHDGKGKYGSISTVDLTGNRVYKIPEFSTSTASAATWLITGGNGSTTGVGATSIPVYISSAGVAQPITTLSISHGGTGATTAAGAPWVQKSGDTMTGILTMKGNMYNDAYDGALNMNNSDIYGLNSIYTADTSDGAAEGIHFYRDATHVDTFWVSGGDLLFVPNRAIGTNTSKANSQKISRFTANPTSGQVVVTDGTTGGIKSSGYTIAKSVPSDAKFTDTTYSAGTGISLSGTTFSNSGVRTTTIYENYLRVNTNGTNADLTIPYATNANKLIQNEITIQTGDTTQQHITLQTLMTWLITTKQYIPSNMECYKYLPVSWAYASNDILQLSCNGTNYELQLAGCIIEFWGKATNYNTGVFRLGIHTSPSADFTANSGYTKFPNSSYVEYTCNGSSYNPIWRMETTNPQIIETIPTSAQIYYIPFMEGKTGDQKLRANNHFYYYDDPENNITYFNSGNSMSNNYYKGGLTLHDGKGKYGSISTVDLTGNRVYKIPEFSTSTSMAAAWLIIGGNGSTTGVGSSTQPVYVSSTGVAQPITTLSISHGGTGATTAAGAPWVQKAGDTMTGALVFSSTGNGIKLTDPSGYTYAGVWQNDTNLWIGASASKTTHHRGSTYISTGYDGSKGNPSLYMAIPNTSNTESTSYKIAYKTNSSSSIGDSANPIYANADGQLIATDFRIGAGFNGANHHWGITSSAGTNNQTGNAGKRTALITTDNGLLMWNSTNSKSIWNLDIQKNYIATSLYPTPNDTTGTTSVKYLLYKSNNTSTVGSTATPVYINALGAATQVSANSVLTNLGSTAGASIYAATPRPGVTGVLGPAHGGTGENTLNKAMDALINSLPNGASTPTDADYYVCQYAGGGTANTIYYRRPTSSLYNYIKGKTDTIYVKKSGDTMTDNLIVAKNTSPYISARDTSLGGSVLTASICVGEGHINHGLYSNGYRPTTATFTSSGKWIIYRGSDGEAHSNLKIYGAVYNDYAEMRNVPTAQIEDNPLRPGTCVREVGDGTMVATTERLQRGCKIISDTFGFNIGETEDCKTPIAVSGRVLVYLDQDREVARDYIGWPVCSGPNGTVSIMTEEEEEKYPSRIVGTISEIPDYEKWGSSDVEVNGRIWIYVK